MRGHFLRSSAGAKIFKFIGILSSTTNASSYTFSAASLGNSSPRRTIVVAIAGVSSSTSAVVSSVTIGGNSTTLTASSTGQTSFGFAYLNNSSLTSGDIVVNFSATRSIGCAIAVYNLITLSNTTPKSSSIPSGSGSVTTISTGNLSVIPNGYAMAVLSKGNNETPTWTNVRQNGTATLNSPTTVFFASDTTTTTSSTYVLTASWTTLTAGRIGGISWE